MCAVQLIKQRHDDDQRVLEEPTRSESLEESSDLRIETTHRPLVERTDLEPRVAVSPCRPP